MNRKEWNKLENSISIRKKQSEGRVHLPKTVLSSFSEYICACSVLCTMEEELIKLPQIIINDEVL